MPQLITDRRTLLIGAGATLGLSAMGAWASTPRKGGRFRIGTSDSATTDNLDPQVSESRFTLNLQWQIRNCLVEVGPGGTLVPELAESWEASDDLKTWVFKLRRGVEFHNAKTLTAQNVVYSINLHRAEDSQSSIKTIIADIADVTASAPNEVTITLGSGNAGFASVMALFQLLIVPEGETDFGAGMGTGGYILESFEPGVRSLARRNPNYWKEGRAHFDEVEILAIKDASARTSALLTDKIDAMNFVDAKTADRLRANPAVSILQTAGKAHYLFGLRTDMAPADNNDVRLALKYAIDRQEILDKILGGYGSLGNDQPLSAAYECFDLGLEQRSYDPDRARSLIKKAGHENHVFELSVSDLPFAGATDAATLYSEQAKRAGIEIKVARVPEDGYWSNIWGVKPFFASRWSGRVNEDVMLSAAYTKGALSAGWNATHWTDERFEAALAAARSEIDPAKRRVLYAECQALLHNEGGIIVPVFADFIDAKRANVMHDALSSDWDLDGGRASERWWFA